MYHSVSFSDGDIVDAYEKVMKDIEHTDAPSEAELCRVREGLGSDIVSLHWLRNRIVQLRKGGKLKRSDSPDLFTGT